MRISRAVFVAAVTLLAVLNVLASEENYFAVIMEGHKVGHAITSRKVKGDKVYTSEEMMMTLSRFGAEMVAETTETCIETLDGKPLGFETKMSANGSDSGSKGTIAEDGKMEVFVYAGGLANTMPMEYPEGALMAEGVRLLQLERGLKDGDSFSVDCFVPSMLKVSQSSVQTFGKEEVDLFGRVVTATKQIVTMNIEGQIIPMTEYVGDDMEVYKSTSAAMGMSVELIACDKFFAMSDNDIYDLLDQTLVQCPASLPDRDTLKSVTYYLKPAPDKNVDIPADDNQSVTEKDSNILVTVKPVVGIGKTLLKYDGEKYSGNDEKILEASIPSQYVQSDDKAIIKLAKEAIGDTTYEIIAAKNIESFVGEYITEKSMSVGYATAVEVAKSKQGDCSEHAVLTAALCRAVGIPARVAVGLVYVESVGEKTDVLGGHAWTEAYIDGRWIGLDATRGYGPGHIKLAAGKGDPTDYMQMIGSFGNFTISKVEYEKLFNLKGTDK